MSTHKTIYAEDVNYFQTSKTHAETWIARAKKEITNLPNGKVTGEGYGSFDGKSMFVLHFSIGLDDYKIAWPVLQSRKGNDKAAKVQAATLLYHDVKHKCVVAKVFGAKVAFAGFLLLPDGSTINERVETANFALPAHQNLLQGEIVK